MAEDGFPGINFADATFEADGEEKTGDTPSTDAPAKTRRRRSDAGVPRGSRSTTAAPRKPASSKLAADIADPIAKLAMGLAFQSPTAAAVLITRGDETAKALVAIAEKHPRMLAALQRVSQVGPATDLVQTGVMLLIAVQMDMGRIPPDHPLASLTGVSQLFLQTHSVEPQEDGTNVFPVFTPPPGFGDGPPGPNNPGHPRYSFTAGRGAGSMT